MIQIRIITVGSLKESYWKQAEAEYLKRLSPYARITFVEKKEQPFRSPQERDAVQKKEATAILQQIKPNEIVIALHERGKEMDSISLSKLLYAESQQGACITFVIGGPLGLHPSILSRANKQLSLSQLTFPHQMVRTILLEQLYRSVMIQKGKYHY